MSEQIQNDTYSGPTVVHSVKHQNANVIHSQTLIMGDDNSDENHVVIELIPDRKITFEIRKENLGPDKHIDINLISSDEKNTQNFLIKHSGEQGLLGATRKKANLYIRTQGDNERGVYLFKEQISFSFSLEKKGAVLFFNVIIYSERLSA